MRGGDERANVFAEDAELVERGGVWKTENGSDASFGCKCTLRVVVVVGVVVVVVVVVVVGGSGADSKKEKSASAQASTTGADCIVGARGGVLGVAGSGSKVLDSNTEKSWSTA